MDLVFHATNGFEIDLKRLPKQDAERVVEKLNGKGIVDVLNSAAMYSVPNALLPQLKDGMDSTLYSMPIGDIRVVLAIDEDPLFDQRIVTLFRIVRRQDLDEACRGTAECLYQDCLAGLSDRGNDATD